MAQFDVYRNLSKSSKDAYPFLVDIQHSVLSDLSTRLVVPLAKSNQGNSLAIKKLTPEIDFDGVSYVFLSQQITTVPIDTLKVAVGTLEESRVILIDAIDFAITGI